MDFKDYWKNGCFGEYHDIYAKNLAEQFYNAGQQSKQEEANKLQEEIDALKEKLKKLEDHTFINYDYERDDDQHSYWSGYNVALGEIAAIIEENNNDT